MGILRLQSAVQSLQSMTAWGGGAVINLITLKFVARWGVSGQRRAPAALSPRKNPGTHYTGSWVGPRDGLKGNGEKKIPGFQLYRLCSPGPRIHCVAYTAHRHVRKADRCTARLVSTKCVLAHASRFQRTSDSPSTCSREFAFPRDMAHIVDARFATEIFVRSCCPQ